MTGNKTSKTRKAAKVSKSKVPPRKSAAPPRTQAAAPLRASVPKRVGAMPAHEASAESSLHASYHPKTDPPPLHRTPGTSRTQVPNVVAVARPWMMLGLHVALTSFALQARLARAAMSMTPAPCAIWQGTEAASAWLAALRGHPHKPDKG